MWPVKDLFGRRRRNVSHEKGKKRRSFSEKLDTGKGALYRRRGIRFRKTYRNRRCDSREPPFGTGGRNAFCEKTPKDKKASTTRRNVGKGVPRHRRNRRGIRFRQTEYKAWESRYPDSVSVGGSLYYPPTLLFLRNSVCFSYRVFRQQLVPVSGKVPANAHRCRFRETSGTATDEPPVSKRNKVVRKNSRARRLQPRQRSVRDSGVYRHRLARLSQRRMKHDGNPLRRYARPKRSLSPPPNVLQAVPDRFGSCLRRPFESPSTYRDAASVAHAGPAATQVSLPRRHGYGTGTTPQPVSLRFGPFRRIFHKSSVLRLKMQ